MADVSISYKNTEIATMNATGVKTLLTGDCFCEDDIVVSYTKPSASLQSKTVSPTTSQQTVSPDNGYDGLSSVTVNAMPSGSASTPATTITANPTISVSSGGLITASVSGSQSVTPTVSAGYVSSGTAGTVTVSGSATQQLTTQAAQTITPTTTNQTIASGKYLTGVQTIEGIVCTNLTAENIADGVTVKIGTATDDDSVASVTGTHQGGGGGPYDVYITLSAPMSPSGFSSFTIYEAVLAENGSYSQGQQIGSITTPDGNTHVTVNSPANGIVCVLDGAYPVYPQDVSDYYSFGACGIAARESDERAIFVVGGNGQIDIGRIDWDD